MSKFELEDKIKRTLSFGVICILVVSLFDLISCSESNSPTSAIGSSENREYLDLTYSGSTLWNNCNDIDVEGNRAFYAMDNGLLIIDISDAANPRQISETYLPCKAHRVRVEGDYAYLFGSWQLNVVSISTAQVVGTLDIPSDGNLEVKNGYVYLAGGSGLKIINITNPSSPILERSVAEGCNHVAIENDMLYLTTYRGAIAYDISNPINPVRKGMVSIDHCRQLVVKNSVCYVWSAYTAPQYPGPSYSRITVVDFANPMEPVVIGGYPSNGNSGFTPRMNLAVDESNLFLLTSGQLSIIDVSDPSQTILVGSYGSSITGNEQGGLAINNNYAFVPNMKIISIVNKSNPYLAGEFGTAGATRFADIEGDYAYVIKGNNLNVVNISDPSDLSVLGIVSTSSILAYDVEVDNGYAYICDGDVKIINVTNPYQPVLVGEITSSGHAEGISISGNYAYVADGNPGLQVYDIAKKTNPQHVSTLDLTSNVTDVDIAGAYAYLISPYGPLWVINIADPSSPRLAAKIRINGNANALTVKDSMVYVACDFFGLTIVDVSDPHKPVAAATVNTEFQAMDVFADGNFAYVANFWYNCSGSGITVVDINDPYSPFKAGGYEVAGTARSVCAKDGYAYILDGSGIVAVNHQNF